MPGYITKALQHFGHECLQQLQNSPPLHVAPTYSAKAQYVETKDPGIPLNKEGQSISKSSPEHFCIIAVQLTQLCLLP
jgi:hypothetical protein